MDDSKLTPCFNRLIQSLRMNKAKKKGITIFLGAGCSLTSSNKDITTYGIVQSLVKQYSSGTHLPENWKDLYELFVNNVWSGQGTEDRKQLLEDYFEDMKPSIGYENLRWLLENGYINNIITTNFDLMVDQILEGLSYQLIVCTEREVVGDCPEQFTLIKAHGDLRHGQLRFAPSELSQLPDELSQEIRKATQHTVIVIGYRGQDIGILNALYDVNTHNAYWISLEKPDQFNNYENERIYSWMQLRNSMNNFLYGEEFGCFDKILSKIKDTLLQLKESEENNKKKLTQELWGQSTLFDYFYLNKRFLNLFETLYQYLDEQVSESLWAIAGPFYAPSFEKLMREALKLLNDREISHPYYCIENEVDALIFSIASSIWMASQGYPYTSSELLDAIKQSYMEKQTEITISSNFWMAIDLLSDPEKWKEKNFCQITSVSFCFDQNRDLSVILKDVNLYDMHQLIEIMDCLLIFCQTSGNESSDYYGHRNKQILEKYLYEIQNLNNKIILKMSTISREYYQDLYSSILKHYFTEHTVGDRCTLYHNPIYIDFTIERPKFNGNINIFESFEQKAIENQRNFIKDFIPERYIERSFSKVMNDFLASDNNGLFIIGESGCGKTSALKQWIQSLEPEKYIPFPILGREQDGSLEMGAGYFDTSFYDKNKLGHLQIMLEERQSTLLLIFDAINEIQGKFSYILQNYEKLLNFGDALSIQQLKNIRLIITCRYDSYQQLKRSSNLSPSNRSFFSVMENNEVNTVYTIPYFEKNDIEAFLKLYEDNDKTSLKYSVLRKEFGNLICLPINLRIICEVQQNIGISKDSINKKIIFEKWFKNLQNMGKTEGLNADAINHVIDYTIHHKYFCNDGTNLKTHILATGLKGKISNVLTVYEWLMTHGVYEKNVSTPNLVQFSHDNIEEYFLSRYIRTNYTNRLSDIDTIMITETLELAIVERALKDVFFHTYEADELIFINLFIDVVRKKSEKLLPVCIQIFFEISNTDHDKGYDLLQTINKYLLQKDFHMLIELMLSIASQKLDMIENMILAGIQVINKIIASTNCHNDHNLCALALYLAAKGQYVLASENDTDKYEKAYTICKQSEQYLNKDSPYQLIDNINILKSLLLQIQGDLNKAIELMEDCYERQKENGLYDTACQSALNLGAMYREMTQFDKAITLYKSIDTHFVTDELIVSRLNMNIGIIYKNKIQNAMFSGETDSKQNIELYNIALENFERTCIFAEKQDNVPLRLQIYAELVECTCVGYYLNLATIEEAASWVSKMEDIIGRYPIPVERIQILRMRSRVLTLKCEFVEALDCLEKGYLIADTYKLPYLATDCCNLITGIISDNLNNIHFMNDEVLQKGIKYGEYAINYYKQLKNANHRYLQDSILKYKRIKDIYDKS